MTEAEIIDKALDDSGSTRPRDYMAQAERIVAALHLAGYGLTAIPPSAWCEKHDRLEYRYPEHAPAPTGMPQATITGITEELVAEHHHRFERAFGWNCSCGMTREQYRDQRKNA